ncbi:hypothetical protein EZV62_000267 [Acer yangbiense]|uniref:Pectinesterase n=1 Tax=Acer yangbiense TaxID=1000413 RepID=A0A5C7IRF5_9ROSI|nr:hypothetical protein EZV62_000267 [Acer yangbiense]
MAFGGFRNVEETKKKKIAMISVGCLFLVAVVAALAVGLSGVGGGDNSKGESGKVSTSSKAIKALCQPTDYEETCVNSLKSANTSDPKELIGVGFQVTVNALKEAMNESSKLKELANYKDSRTSQALEDCEELMDSAIDDLQKSYNKLGKFDMSKLGDYVDELKIWLSGAVTFEESCLDEFENITNNDAGEKMKKILQASRELTSNGLAMVSEMSSVLTSYYNTNRKLLSHKYNSDRNEESSDQNEVVFADENGYPSWVNAGRRKLLAATPATINPNAVVAKDGSGQFKTITDALNTVPKENNKTFVIYIKSGVYKETFNVTKKMTNVMFIGDGATKTKITGNKNYVDGTNTMRTATVCKRFFSIVLIFSNILYNNWTQLGITSFVIAAILGANFMAKDIGFENTAGAIKHQAVALRVQADKSVFYNCQMDGYQDTLYVHAHAQFYRDCTISGTIDFIFGDAAVVFQNCKMIVRKPLENQSCIVTAQGRNNSRSATGIVLQNCTITGEPAYLAVKDVNKAYLGRPWKEYSRTIVMQSQIDDIIQPEGWLLWTGDFALNTLWYGEYGNRGAGAVQTGRVTWKGIKKVSAEQANWFTVAQFIKDDWIKLTGVPYSSGLIKV